MAVDPGRSAGRLTYDDTAYFFCSLAWAAEFRLHPPVRSAFEASITEELREELLRKEEA